MRIRLRWAWTGTVALVAGLALVLVQPLTAGRGAASGYSCNGQIVKIFDSSNGGAVVNGGAPPSFTTKGPYCLTSIGTYHWNNGKGQTPGTLSLSRTGGPAGFASKVGPFAAQGSAGQGGAPNVNWLARVQTTPTPTVLDGTYACRDSSPSTWSANTAGGPGFCIVYGIPAQGSPTPAGTTTTTGTTTPASPPKRKPGSSLEIRLAYALLDSHIQQAITELDHGTLKGTALDDEIGRLIDEQYEILGHGFTFPEAWLACTRQLGGIMQWAVQADAAFDIAREEAGTGAPTNTRIEANLLIAALALDKVEGFAHDCHALSTSERDGFRALAREAAALQKIAKGAGAKPGQSDAPLIQGVGALERLKHDLLAKLPAADGVPFDFVERETVKELDLMHKAQGRSEGVKDLLRQAARHKDGVYAALKKAAH